MCPTATHLQPLFLYTNCRSIKNKLIDFASLISLHSPSVVALTETWLSKEHPSSLLSLSGYDVYRRDRSEKGGGVLLAVKTSVKSHFVSASDQVEILTVDVQFNSRVRVIVVYNPNGSDADYFTKLMQNFVFCAQ